MESGILLTSPTGAKFWHRCDDPARGWMDMTTARFLYGVAWGNPATKVEFGSVDEQGKFTVTESVPTGW